MLSAQSYSSVNRGTDKPVQKIPVGFVYTLYSRMGDGDGKDLWALVDMLRFRIGNMLWYKQKFTLSLDTKLILLAFKIMLFVYQVPFGLFDLKIVSQTCRSSSIVEKKWNSYPTQTHIHFESEMYHA